MCYTRVTERKIENLKKESKMRIRTLIFLYTIHFAYLNVYTKFHNPKSSSSEKTLTKNVHMCNIRVTEGKSKKEGKMSLMF